MSPTAPFPCDPPPTPPTLVAATYAEGSSVTLTFDRPVNATSIAPGSVRVDDTALVSTFVSTGAVTVVSPETITVTLAEGEGYTGEGILLTATAATGIVAADGGAMWAGVEDVELPFP